jgi:uncharacterized alkaline shock family protein YloU
VVITLLLLSLVAILVAVFPESTVNYLWELFNTLEITTFGRMILTVAFGFTAICALTVIYFEVRPEGRRGVLLSEVKGGKAELSTDTIASRIKETVEALPDVVRSTPMVVSRGSYVDVRMDIIASPGTDVSAKASEVVQVVRNLAEKELRIKITNPKVHIKYGSLAPQKQKA